MRNGSKSEESRWAALVQRHHTLVDRKYTIGLTAAEIQELDGIDDQLDQLDGPLYQSLMDRARGMIGQREGVG